MGKKKAKSKPLTENTVEGDECEIADNQSIGEDSNDEQ